MPIEVGMGPQFDVWVDKEPVEPASLDQLAQELMDAKRLYTGQFSTGYPIDFTMGKTKKKVLYIGEFIAQFTHQEPDYRIPGRWVHHFEIWLTQLERRSLR
jgi:hypothetical protein